MKGRRAASRAQPRRRRKELGASDSPDLARVCARLAEEKKGEDISVLDLRELTYITDFFVVVSGSNERQLRAISDAIQQEMARRSVHLIGIEGVRSSRWILLDYGDVVAHLFDQEWRRVYDLELLWGDAPRLTWRKGRRRSKRGLSLGVAVERLERRSSRMAIKCTECNEESYKAVDRETDVQGRRFVLLECEKCSRTIIVPEADSNPGAANPAEADTPP